MATKPTLSDSQAALKMALGKVEPDLKYDINGDGVVDTTDYTGLLKAYLGKDPGFAFVGDSFSSPVSKTPEEYAAIEKANQERIAAEQKETARRQGLLADAQKIYGNVTADLVANNPNLTPQQLASLATRNYWANESEAFSRVSEGMKNGTAKIIQTENGLAITTGEHPGYDTLYLNPTSQKGVYQFSTPNQVAGGTIHGVIQADPETGKYAPIQDYTKQIQYTPGQSGSFFGNLAGDLGDLYKSLGPIGGIIGNAIAPGLGSALSAIAAIDEGNTTGGIMNALGAAGAYGNAALQAGDTSGLGGTLAENLPEIKTATSAAQLANALQTGNIGSALNAAGNLTGVSADPTIKTALQTVALVQALDSGNTAQAVSLLGQLTDNPDVKVAGDAAKLINAINSGNPLAVQNAAIGLAKTTGAEDIAGTVDQKTIDSVLDLPATKTTADAGSILDSDEVTAGTQQLVDAISNPQNTASYTGTQVADTSGTTGLPSDKVTDQDLEQLGVGLPTGTGTNELTNQDIINIVQGTDTATNGTGKDSVVGGEATTQGGTGEDTIVSDTGTDTLLGGTGEDSVVGGEATTQGGTGTDTMNAGDGSDVIADDGTTEDIQKVIDDTKTEDTDTTDTTCAEGFHWDETLGICVADEDETKTSTDCPDGYVYNVVTETCEPITTDTTGTTKTTTINTGGGGGGTPAQTTQQPALKPESSSGMDLLGLLALMGGSGQQAQPAQPAVADTSGMVDIEDLLANPLQVDPRKAARQSKMAEGGSIDDLLALLDKRS